MDCRLFFHVDTKNKIILDIPKKLDYGWKGIVGLNLLSDENLIDLEWSGHPGFGFIPWEKEYISLLSNYKCSDEMFIVFKNFVKQYISELRWEIETGGIEVNNGYIITTDDRSKLLLNSVYFNIINNPEIYKEDFNFKTPNGTVKFTSEQFKSLFNSVNSFIKECFDKEIEIIEIINKKNSFLELIETDFHKLFSVSNKIKI